MTEYDIVEIFREMEAELINSMSRNLKKHMKDEDIEGLDWTQWQTEQLRGLQEYRERNQKIISKYDDRTIRNLETLLKTTYTDEALKEERKILREIIKGAKVNPNSSIKNKLATTKGTTTAAKVKNVLETDGTFFKVNDKKLNALIEASKGEIKNATKNILRYQDDVYRQVIYKSQVFANTGVKTVYQAVDMATKDFLARGITNITYSNGAKVNIESYAEMCIRTSNKKAKLMGEGQVREDWGVHLVLCSQYGACSPICLPWQGKVYIDDVYSSGKPDGRYPELSNAISFGLFHPNCRHTISTFFEDVNTVPSPMNYRDVKEHNELEQQQRYNERQIRKYQRLKDNSLDPNNKRKYERKWMEWTNRNNDLIRRNGDVLRRDPWRETTMLGNNNTSPNTIKKENRNKLPIEQRLKENRFNIDKSFTFDNEDVRKTLLNQVDELSSKYNLSQEYDLVARKQSNSRTLAYFKWELGDENKPLINFNKSYCTDMKFMADTHKKGMDTGYFVKVDDDKLELATTAHEFGHLIERELIKQNLNIKLDTYQEFKMYKSKTVELARELKNMYRDKYNIDLDVSKDVSRYAATDPEELFAEAFCEMECRKDSKIGDIMRELLSKYNMFKEV